MQNFDFSGFGIFDRDNSLLNGEEYCLAMSHFGEFLYSAGNCKLLRSPLCSFQPKKDEENNCQQTIKVQNEFILSSLKLENSCDVTKVGECPRLYSRIGDLCIAKFDLIKVCDYIIIMIYF